jgi:Flp pilus assembly protein TadG
MTGVRDRGSAVLEFVVVGCALLPLVALGASSAVAVHEAASATSAAAREAARAFVTAPTPEQATVRAGAAARLAFADRGRALPVDALTLRCDGPCLVPGTTVLVTVDWSMPLPFLPGTVSLVSEQRMPVDEFRGEPE